MMHLMFYQGQTLCLTPTTKHGQYIPDLLVNQTLQSNGIIHYARTGFWEKAFPLLFFMWSFSHSKTQCTGSPCTLVGCSRLYDWSAYIWNCYVKINTSCTTITTISTGKCLFSSHWCNKNFHRSVNTRRLMHLWLLESQYAVLRVSTCTVGRCRRLPPWWLACSEWAYNLLQVSSK
jgi:hypothetical protein